MKYGNWELRDDSVYYPSQNIILYPSSNSADEGSLNLESNIRSIIRRITKKSYKLREGDFHVTLNSDGKSLNVTSGEANIQGYHLIANRNLNINIPVTSSVTPYTLGLCLSYDAANNVTGDVVNYDGNDNELFSGVYLKFFDECNIQHRHDNILMLARVWVKEGTVVSNYLIEEGSSPYSGWFIENGIENDPVNDHAIYGDKVEVEINGVSLNGFDTLPVVQFEKQLIMDDGTTTTAIIDVTNLSDVSKYGNMYYEIERNPLKYTKAPSFTTDIQDFVNYMPDWYVSKYGDYMTGGLRFDLLSYDAKRQLDEENAVYYNKDKVYDGQTDDIPGIFHNTAGAIISPRTLGNVHIDAGRIADIEEVMAMYSDGGTIMSVIPQSYPQGIDHNNGRSGGYAALISQTEGDIGVRIRGLCGNMTRLSSCLHKDTSQEYFTIEHSHEMDTTLSSISFKNGNIFIDSWKGRTAQIFVNPVNIDDKCVATRFTPNGLELNSHNYNTFRTSSIGSASTTGIDSDTLVRVGIGSELNSRLNAKVGVDSNADPYIAVGNVSIQSNNPVAEISTSFSGLRMATIGIIDVNGMVKANSRTPIREIYAASNSGSLPYINIVPGIYSNRYIAEDFLIVGTDKENDLSGGSVLNSTLTKTVIGKTFNTEIASYSNSYRQAFIEQTTHNFMTSDGETPAIFNWIGTHTGIYNHRQANGIYSCGNIGATNLKLPQHCNYANQEVYTDNSEWVRFTQYRYDKDNDKQYIGDARDSRGNTDGSHERTLGNPYNIEFNTTVANKRSNQIIWNYRGSRGTKDQPLTLSYIHDETTIYPNSEYFDHNLYRHQNPSYGVRDFLRIDGGGLSIHGDLNNPTLAGDANNTTGHLGLTLIHGRIYSAAYNDYAETYEKSDASEEAGAGMVVMLDVKTGKYKICDEAESSLVVGVISDNYGMLIGGQVMDTVEAQSECLNQLQNYTVGVCGKVPVRIEGQVVPGNLLISSATKGHACAVLNNNVKPGTIIGKALSEPYEKDGDKFVMMQIMLS